jgi:hypothetical protein
MTRNPLIVTVLLAALVASTTSYACVSWLLGQHRSPFGPFSETNDWPAFGQKRADRSVVVLVGSRMYPPESYHRPFNGPTLLNLNDPKFPSLPHEILDVSQIDSKEHLKRVIQIVAEQADVIFFEMHSNASGVQVNDKKGVSFGANDFKGIDLREKVVAFTGCQAGLRSYQTLATWGLPSLLEGVMRHTNARAAIGCRRYTYGTPIDNSQFEGKEELLRSIDPNLVQLAELAKMEKKYDSPDLMALTWYLLLESGQFEGGGYRPFWSVDPEIPLLYLNARIAIRKNLPKRSDWRILQRIAKP